jgi:acetate kinase
VQGDRRDDGYVKPVPSVVRPLPPVLAINAGSSSIKFAVFEKKSEWVRQLHGLVDRIGLPGTSLQYRDAPGIEARTQSLGDLDHASAAGRLVDWLAERADVALLQGIGHRIVHGGPRHMEPARVTVELLDELRRLRAYAPDHLPIEIGLIERIRDRFPECPQAACFDTSFHRDLPRVARILPLPRVLQAEGVQRYGFHGLSYAFLMQELARVAGEPPAQARIILAHLGNGASLAAVRGGRSIDTSMAFTPASGIPMSTRSGDVDPGLVRYLAQTRQLGPEAFHRMVNQESGLLGLSETSSDVRDLLQREASDERAREALDVFCYHVRKWIGGFAAALGGVDTLVFAGGIGENAWQIRSRICAELRFLGIELDANRNAGGMSVISSDASTVAVRVIRTDEELMIARAVSEFLGGPEPGAPE